jgi:hypothetical protein
MWAATACGGTPASTYASNTKASSIGSVYDTTVSARTARVEVVVHVASPRASTFIVADGQVDLSGSGCALTVFDSGTAVHEFLSGLDLYFEVPPGARAANGGKPWAEVDLRRGHQEGPGVAPGSALTEVDPAALLSVLRLRPSGSAVRGRGVVGGHAATEYRLTYPTADLGRLDGDGMWPGGVLGLMARVATPVPRFFPVDVWVDHQGRLVQLEASATLKREPPVPSAAQAALANQLPSTLTVRLDLDGFGEPVDLDLPAPPEVAQVPVSQLQAGLL